MEENEDYEYVDMGGNRKVKIPHMLFILGTILVIAVFLFGNITEEVDLQLVLIWISVFAIGVSILWGVRKKVGSILASFLILMAIYFIAGSINQHLFGGEPYSYGVMTFLLVGMFVFWISFDGRVSANDVWKMVGYAVLMHAINVSGWLPEVNELIASAFEWSGGLPI